MTIVTLSTAFTYSEYIHVSAVRGSVSPSSTLFDVAFHFIFVWFEFIVDDSATEKSKINNKLLHTHSAHIHEERRQRENGIFIILHIHIHIYPHIHHREQTMEIEDEKKTLVLRQRIVLLGCQYPAPAHI